MEGKEEDETSLMRTELVAMVKTIIRVNKEQVSEEERYITSFITSFIIFFTKLVEIL